MEYLICVNTGEEDLFQRDTLGDVYDGRVWKNLKDLQGEPFFNERGSLGLMFNCDWFQPFDFTVYSVGVMYLTVLNLPRSIRFKPENIFINVP